MFIADEVQSGFARTGAMFACEHEGIVPDLVTTAKGIAGGLPLAGVTGRTEIMNAPHAGGVGGTFGGNPVACAAALASIRAIQDEGLVRAGPGDRVGGAAAAAGAGRARPADRRRPRPGRDAGRRAGRPVVGRTGGGGDEGVAAAAHARGLILLTCGTYGNVLRLLPPLSMPDHLLAEGLDVLEEAFGTVT